MPDILLNKLQFLTRLLDYFKSLGWKKLLLRIFLVLVLIFLIYFGISYISEREVRVSDILVTNITDSSVTVTFRTNELSHPRVIISENNDFNIFTQYSKPSFVDDRDTSDRFMHHVTITGLNSNSKYYYRISTGLKNVNVTYPTLETGPVLDSIIVPSPTYSQLPDNVSNDSIIYLTLGDGSSQTLSTILNTNNAFTLDKSNIRTKDLTQYATYKDGDYLSFKIVNNDGTSTFSGRVGNDQPVNPIISPIVKNNVSEKLNNNIISQIFASVDASNPYIYQILGVSAPVTSTPVSQPYTPTIQYQSNSTSQANSPAPSAVVQLFPTLFPPTPKATPPTVTTVNVQPQTQSQSTNTNNNNNNNSQNKPSGCSNGQTSCSGGLQQQCIGGSMVSVGVCNSGTSKVTSQTTESNLPSADLTSCNGLPQDAKKACEDNQRNIANEASSTSTTIKTTENAVDCSKIPNGQAQDICNKGKIALQVQPSSDATTTATSLADCTKIQNDAQRTDCLRRLAPPVVVPDERVCETGGDYCNGSTLVNCVSRAVVRTSNSCASQGKICCHNPPGVADTCSSSCPNDISNKIKIIKTDSCPTGQNFKANCGECGDIGLTDNQVCGNTITKCPTTSSTVCMGGKETKLIYSGSAVNNVCQYSMQETGNTCGTGAITSDPCSPFANPTNGGLLGACCSVNSDSPSCKPKNNYSKTVADQYDTRIVSTLDLGYNSCGFTSTSLALASMGVEDFDNTMDTFSVMAKDKTTGYDKSFGIWHDDLVKATKKVCAETTCSVAGYDYKDPNAFINKLMDVTASGQKAIIAVAWKDDGQGTAIIDATGFPKADSHFVMVKSCDKNARTCTVADTLNSSKNGRRTEETLTMEQIAKATTGMDTFQDRKVTHWMQVIAPDKSLDQIANANSQDVGVRLDTTQTSENKLDNGLLSFVNAASTTSLDGTYQVSATGVYNVNSISGYTVYTKEVRVLDQSDMKIKFFDDLNGDGIRESNEPYINQPLSVNLEKVSEIQKTDLKAGWNLINMNIVSDSVKTASDLLIEIARQGGYATHVSTYINGKWTVYTLRAGVPYGEDFYLVPTQGYFVKVFKPVSLEIEGKFITANTPIYMNTGWNLLGLRTLSSENASNFIDNINKNNNIFVDTVTNYENGRYGNLVKNDGIVYGQDFVIDNSRGYFVRATKGGDVITNY